MLRWLSRNLFYPLWDLKDGSIKLKELKSLEQTQWHSAAYLVEQQWNRLKEMLNYVYANCDYYKATFQNSGITPQDINAPDALLKLPILTKKDIQENTERLISKGFTKSSLITAKTGGSTGVALKLYFDKQCGDKRNAAAIRSDKWASWDLGSKKAAIWGNPPQFDTLKKWLRNVLVDKILYLDTMDLNDESMSEFIEKYNRFKPDVVFGHSHSIYLFAAFLEKNNISIPPPVGIISTSMMLMPHERVLIERMLKCRVTDRYGCEEVGLIGCECEQHNGMHLNIDHLYIEFLKDDGTYAEPGEEGKIIITDLINHGMPMIRYRVEDVGIPTDRQCPCGRGLPLMEGVAGRVADFLIRKNGSQVAGVSLVERTLTAVPGIEQMQIVQNTLDTITLNIVRMNNYAENSEGLLTREFQKVFGDDIKLDFSYVDRIPQERSGKYRFSICNVISIPGSNEGHYTQGEAGE